MLRQRIGQRRTAHHLGTDRSDQVAHIGAFGLFQQRGERLFQRQAGFQQAGQLAREKCQLDRGQTIAECAAFGQSRRVKLGFDRSDADRHQALRAQLGARGTRAVGIDHAFFGGACRIDGFVTECWHAIYP